LRIASGYDKGRLGNFRGKGRAILNNSKREDYIAGRLFHIGDIVISKTTRTLHEVFSLGTNYLTVCNSKGEISKMWINDAVVSNALREDFEDMIPYSSRDQLSYYGYVTQNFNEEIVNEFLPYILKEHDKIAMMKLIRETDKLLRCINNKCKTNSDFKDLHENVFKYIHKIKEEK
jgi:hypothetical protein